MEQNHDELITQFCSVTGASPSTAQSALQSTNWNLEEAVTFFYASQDAPAGEEDAAMDEDEPTPQPVPSSAPQPATSSSSSSSRSARPPPKNSKLKTLKDLQGGSSGAHDSDDEEDDKQDFFAGGEKSGLAVQNPDKPQDHFKNIINQAKQNRERPGDEDKPQQSSNFSGRAQTLGGDDAPSQVIQDARPAASRPASIPRVERVLHLWSDGFSVDDGPLYRFDDPANAPTLALINQGRAPLGLLGVQPGQEVDLQLNPHKDEKYVQPKKAYKPFGGSGNRLGSPTPGASGSSGAQAAASTATTAIPAAASTSATSSPSVNVDDSQPILTLQVRLGDGTRLQSRFNTTHTVGDVYEFVTASNAESRNRPFALMTTFPSKELTDKSVVLGDMAEFKRGGVVVQKWA